MENRSFQLCHVSACSNQTKKSRPVAFLMVLLMETPPKKTLIEVHVVFESYDCYAPWRCLFSKIFGGWIYSYTSYTPNLGALPRIKSSVHVYIFVSNGVESQQWTQLHARVSTRWMNMFFSIWLAASTFWEKPQFLLENFWGITNFQNKKSEGHFLSNSIAGNAKAKNIIIW